MSKQNKFWRRKELAHERARKTQPSSMLVSAPSNARSLHTEKDPIRWPWHDECRSRVFSIRRYTHRHTHISCHLSSFASYALRPSCVTFLFSFRFSCRAFGCTYCPQCRSMKMHAAEAFILLKHAHSNRQHQRRTHKLHAGPRMILLQSNEMNMNIQVYEIPFCIMYMLVCSRDRSPFVLLPCVCVHASSVCMCVLRESAVLSFS